MKLVIAYDGSETADAAVRAAAALWPGAAAVLACVSEAQVVIGSLGPTVDAGVIEALREDAETSARERADAGVALAAGLGLDARPAVPEPAEGVAAALVALAGETGADAIVCGTRGRGPTARMLLGSVAARLLYDGDRPTLVVPAGAPLGDGPALVAFDGSDGALEAVRIAARLLDRPLRVTYAWSSPVQASLAARGLLHGPMPEVGEIVTELDEWIRGQAQEVADAGAQAARDAGAEATAAVADNRAGTLRALRDAIAAEDVALAVVGPRGHGMAASALLGSVSARLLHHAEKPVLLTR